MKITERKIGPNVVIQVLESRLGADKAVAFKEALGRYLEQKPMFLVLDLSKVEFIDSSGLGAILSLLKRMPTGGELLIGGATEAVTSMLKLTRMDRVFTICKTVDEAVNTLAH